MIQVRLEAGVARVGHTCNFCNVTLQMFSGAKFLSLSENAVIEEAADIGDT